MTNPFVLWDESSAQVRPAVDPQTRLRMADEFTERECRQALRRRDIGRRERAACWKRLRAITKEK